MKLERSATELEVYSESRKRRTFVGTLRYYQDKDVYEFQYDKKYVSSKTAIPVGYELDLFKQAHISKKGKLFPSFSDRIPSRQNPAYEDYCRSQGISPNERNPIILMGTIGRRGPSSFVFEPSMKNHFTRLDIVTFRKELGISRHEFALAFELNEPTLQRIETNKSHDLNTLRRIQTYLEFPAVALWQLLLTGKRIHGESYSRLIDHFTKLKNPEIRNVRKERFRLE